MKCLFVLILYISFLFSLGREADRSANGVSILLKILIFPTSTPSMRMGSDFNTQVQIRGLSLNITNLQGYSRPEDVEESNLKILLPKNNPW